MAHGPQLFPIVSYETTTPQPKLPPLGASRTEWQAWEARQVMPTPIRPVSKIIADIQRATVPALRPEDV